MTAYRLSAFYQCRLKLSKGRVQKWIWSK